MMEAPTRDYIHDASPFLQQGICVLAGVGTMAFIVAFNIIMRGVIALSHGLLSSSLLLLLLTSLLVVIPGGRREGISIVG